MTEPFRLSRLWDQVSVWLRGNMDVALPVAGAFFFLPSVVFTWMVPAGGNVITPLALIPMALVLLFQTFGQLVIFSLLLNPDRPTVADAIRIARRRILAAVGVQLMIFAMICALMVLGQLLVLLFGGSAVRQPVATEAGLMRFAMMGMLIVSPAILYLLARLSVVFPVLTREPLTPYEALRRAFDLTVGHGWKIVLLLAIALLLYFFVQAALGAAVGSIFTLGGKLLGLEALAALLTLVFVSAIGALATLVITTGVGFLYRDLSG